MNRCTTDLRYINFFFNLNFNKCQFQVYGHLENSYQTNFEKKLFGISLFQSSSKLVLL